MESGISQRQAEDAGNWHLCVSGGREAGEEWECVWVAFCGGGGEDGGVGEGCVGGCVHAGTHICFVWEGKRNGDEGKESAVRENVLVDERQSEGESGGEGEGEKEGEGDREGEGEG